MTELERALADLKASLCRDVDVGGLYARSNVAHKWKAPWRALLLRESVAWRTQDLLEQSHTLYVASGLLGARILLRSAFETLGILVYLNQTMRDVVAGTTDFHAFSETTTRLLLGSRDKSTRYESINILTVLQKANKRYAGLEDWYAALSESAHPNYEGMVLGYSKDDPKIFLTTFENRWAALYGDHHPSAILACLAVFESEYNHEWPAAFEALERWIEVHDDKLEATKRAPKDG